MVRNGEGLTNLTLMRTLYWVFTLVLIAVGYGNMPLSMQLKQGFPENTVIGKMCLHMDFLFSKESFKSRLLGFAFPFLWLMYGYLWLKRANQYISGLWTVSQSDHIFWIGRKLPTEYFHLRRNPIIQLLLVLLHHAGEYSADCIGTVFRAYQQGGQVQSSQHHVHHLH